MSASSLNIAVFQVISFLTRPLIPAYAPAQISKLQILLEANLLALFAPSWAQSLRGRRCLVLSTECLPPRAVYTACISAGIQWFDWAALLLGGREEYHLFVDPGCIAVRLGRSPSGELITIWSDEAASKPTRAIGEERLRAQFLSQEVRRTVPEKKTLAQQMLEEDSEDDEFLFTLIADEVGAPTWSTPVTSHFSAQPRSLSPFPPVHSRSSSRSSTSSGGLLGSSPDSYESADGYFASSQSPDRRPVSRREKARAARVVIDTSKTVVAYDGGKTTVLPGGVMLGAKSQKTATVLPRIQTNTMSQHSSWRV